MVLSREPDPEPVVPADAPIQEILFRPPSANESAKAINEDLIILSFVMSEPHTSIQMEKAVRTWYAIYGTSGLKSLEDAILGNQDQPWDWKLKGEPYLRGKNEPEQMIWSEDEQEIVSKPSYTQSPMRQKLAQRYRKERDRLKAIQKVTQEAVKETASVIVIERIEESQKLVLKETKRYLGLSSNDDKTAAAVLDSESLHSLTGYDILPLATALLRIDHARVPVKQAEDLEYKVNKPTIDKRAVLMHDLVGQLSEEEVRDQSMLISIADEAIRMYPDTKEMQSARKMVIEQEAQFAAFVAAEAVTFPILYRLWSVTTAQSVRQAISDYRPSGFPQHQRALSASSEFRRAILTSLRKTWNASKRVKAQVQEKELIVWRYPPLITAALFRLAIAPGTVEWQIATERVDDAETSILSTLSTAAGFFEIGLSLAGVPPVAVAVELLNLLLSAWEVNEQLLKKIEEQDIFDSSLNPAHSFAAEPSFVGVIVDLAFLALNARDTVRSLSNALVLKKGVQMP